MAEYHLNAQQQEAVDTLEGALLLLAGAGTGKTRVIVQRIGNLLRHGVEARNILAVTFTNKAAREMRERVKAMIGGTEKDTPLVSTFHSFCAEVLRHFADRIGFTGKFTFATEGYQNGLLREIAVELGYAADHVDPYGWLYAISLAKAAMLTPEQYAASGRPDAEKLAAIYRRYQQRLRQMNMMDFDDLLVYTVELWTRHPDVLEGYRERFQYLMIDEYQDTNTVQLHLMVMLAGRRANICAVGDDDQSIYGWRGADQRNILDFERHFPQAKVIRLEQNYRSTNTILRASNAVIAHNRERREKRLWSNQGTGEKLLGVLCPSEKDEAAFVAEHIFNLASRGYALRSRERDWTRYAVLARTGGQHRLLEEAFHRQRIPYVVVGSKSFYQRKEILDLLSMLELAVNPKGDMNLVRVVNVPPRGIGDATLAKLAEQRDISHRSMFELLGHPDFTSLVGRDTVRALAEFQSVILRCAEGADKSAPVLPRVQRLVNDLGYLDKLILMYRPRADALARRDNVLEFLNSIGEYDEERHGQGTLVDFLEKLALQDANDRREKEKGVTDNAVNLMTIHAAKGLEFPVVFLVGFEQGLFPHNRALEENGLEEERRLCYVAMTRAKEELIISYAEKRRVMNQVTIARPSVFLGEIPEDLIAYTTPEKIRKGSATSTEASLSRLAEIKARLKAGMKSPDGGT